MKRSATFARLGLAAALLAPGCDQAAPPPAPASVLDADLVALEKAVAWPDPVVGTVVTLGNIYMAKGLQNRGRTYFEARVAETPGDGVFLAYAGLFRAQTALQQPLLSRVSWVEDAIETLDEAVELDDTLPRFLRAVTFARLPERFDVAEDAIAELEILLRDEDVSFLFTDNVTESTRQALLRQGWQAMALAAQTAGRGGLAEEAWAKASARAQSPNDLLVGTNYSVDGVDGFRFARPTLEEVRPGLWLTHGYDFGDMAFIQTDAGIVAVDAGTHLENAARALEDVRAAGAQGPVHTVFLTHAHWDHIGGLDGLLEPGTQVIAQSHFADELEIVNEAAVDYTWFFGERTVREERYGPLYDVTPDLLVEETLDIPIGGVSFRMHAFAGGETEDQLLIELPEEGIIFVGDAFMPYLGAPFVGEGSPDDLLATIDVLIDLEPSLLLHGHPPLTERYTADILEPLSAALHEARAQTVRGIIDRKPVVEIVREDPMPDVLRDHPAAVLPAFVLRPQFIQRLHRIRTGYWQPEGEGLVLVSEGEWATAMDMLAGEDDVRWAEVVAGLVTRGEHELAWRMAERGLLRHPDSATLEGLRVRALGGLRMKYQQFNPFKFIVFSELADRPTAPLACGGPEC